MRLFQGTTFCSGNKAELVTFIFVDASHSRDLQRRIKEGVCGEAVRAGETYLHPTAFRCMYEGEIRIEKEVIVIQSKLQKKALADLSFNPKLPRSQLFSTVAIML
jgi:hypothetical protein